jgi:hypothetical protein
MKCTLRIQQLVACGSLCNSHGTTIGSIRSRGELRVQPVMKRVRETHPRSPAVRGCFELTREEYVPRKNNEHIELVSSVTCSFAAASEFMTRFETKNSTNPSANNTVN